jgi:hypothetical protein
MLFVVLHVQYGQIEVVQTRHAVTRVNKPLVVSTSVPGMEDLTVTPLRYSSLLEQRRMSPAYKQSKQTAHHNNPES